MLFDHVGIAVSDVAASACACADLSYATAALAACDRLDEARRADALVLEANHAAGGLV